MTHSDNTAPKMPPMPPDSRALSVDDLLKKVPHIDQSEPDLLFTFRNNLSINNTRSPHKGRKVSIRKTVLEFLSNADSPATVVDIASATGLENSQVSSVAYQLVAAGLIDKQDAAPGSKVKVYTITDLGRQKLPTMASTPKKTKPAQQPETQPFQLMPNFSPSAEHLQDSIAHVLAENSELRNALVDIRSRINGLLGDTEHGDTAS